jgi:hypothetical protein
MSKTIQVKQSDAVAEYQKATKAGKALLEKLFGKETFIQDLTDRVKSFEDACGILGITVSSVLSKYDTPDEIAYKKLKIITKVLNNGWTPDWSDDDQAKYFPWFEWKSKSSGFSFLSVNDYYTLTDSSSRLCFHSRELAEYAAKQFLALYNEFLTIK